MESQLEFSGTFPAVSCLSTGLHYNLRKKTCMPQILHKYITMEMPWKVFVQGNMEVESIEA